MLKEVGAEYKVAKNTLSIVASKGTQVESAKDMFIGPTGIAFSLDDPISLAKKIFEYADKNDKFKVKSGVIEGRIYSADKIKVLSKLPPRKTLLGMLGGTLQAPVSKLAMALNATISQLAYALQALKDKKSA